MLRLQAPTTLAHNITVFRSAPRKRHCSFLAPAYARSKSLPGNLRSQVTGGQYGSRGSSFHTTPPRQHPVFYAVLASVLKASTSIELAKTAARISFTFLPIVLIKARFSQKFLEKMDKHPEFAKKAEFAEKREKIIRGLRTSTFLYRIMLATPILLFGLTVLASLERTPLTGRWRAIILSSEEEETITQQLQGNGWYNTVHGIIAQDGPVRIVPTDDWRYQWVHNSLRQLEQVVPILTREAELGTDWLERGPDDIPLPPPAKHPLRPRFSAKEYLRQLCEKMEKGNCCENIKNDDGGAPSSPSPSSSSSTPSSHLIPGPPYNLLLVERPDCDNAFSFGFGANGAGGIVVYTGFLDNVLAMNQKQEQSSTSREPPKPSKSYLAALLGSFYPSTSAPPPSSSCPPPCPQITEEQNTQLAILLAHELAHLVLAHHLETLSSGTIVIPGTITIFSDMLRAILFPFTMFFGPFVNDAVAALGQVGSGEALRISESCTSLKQEYEADAVSARILAHAGLDARATIAFWERRREASASECSPRRAAQNAGEIPPDDDANGGATSAAMRAATKLAMRIGGDRHPGNAARVENLKKELMRWQMKREKVLKKMNGQTKWEQFWEQRGFEFGPGGRWRG